MDNIDKINCIVNGESYSFSKNTTLLGISKQVDTGLLNHPLVAYVDNVITELDYKVKNDCHITFIDCNDRVGNRIYQKGLIFLLLAAINELYGKDYRIKVCHSIDKAISIKTYFSLTEEILSNIKLKMQEMVALNLPISKCLSLKKDAVKYFDNMLDNKKADTYLYQTSLYVTLYRLGNIYNYFYSCLPISTSCLNSFDLKYIDNRDFVLQFPTPSSNGLIPSYNNHPKIIDAFDKNYKYSKQLDIFTSSDINKKVASGKISDIIKLDETLANNNLFEIAKDIYERKDKIKIVLMAGPSSSGKTTTSKKLSLYLNSFGLNPKPISIDDYFLPREQTPKLPNGEYDFESLNALNIPLFNEHLEKLLNHEEVYLPKFDFITGVPTISDKPFNLEENDIIIIEGLHGLNEELTGNIKKENKYKIYISPLTDLNIDNHNIVSTSDVRLLRRIVRDNRTRGYKAEETIRKWNLVREGEENYIFPYQDEADKIYNTALTYEIGVLKLYAEPLLYEVDSSSIYYEEARRLLDFLDMFLAIPTEVIPSDSILREFIGNSYFE
ncbi:MAG: nucleoside kinase [Candidatus Aphodocola sp.]